MRKMRCYECGKTYDYDIDDFCPKCGAFNQPPKSTTIDANGAVIRVDGIMSGAMPGPSSMRSCMRRTGNASAWAFPRAPAGRRLRRLSRPHRDLCSGRAGGKTGKCSLRWAS